MIKVKFPRPQNSTNPSEYVKSVLTRSKSLPPLYDTTQRIDCTLRQQLNQLKVLFSKAKKQNSDLKEQLSQHQDKFKQLESFSKRMGINCNQGYQTQVKLKAKVLKELEVIKQMKIKLLRNSNLSKLLQYQAISRECKKIVSALPISLGKNMEQQAAKLLQLQRDNERAVRKIYQLQRHIDSLKKREVSKKMSFNLTEKVENLPVSIQQEIDSNHQIIEQFMVTTRHQEISYFTVKKEKYIQRRANLAEKLQHFKHQFQDCSVDRGMLMRRCKQQYKEAFGYNPLEQIEEDKFPNKFLQINGKNLLNNKIILEKHVSHMLIADIKHELNFKITLMQRCPKDIINPLFQDLQEIRIKDLLELLTKGIFSLPQENSIKLSHYLLNDEFDQIEEFTLFSIDKLKSQLICLLGEPMDLSGGREEDIFDQIQSICLQYSNYIIMNFEEIGRQLLTYQQVKKTFGILHMSKLLLEYICMVLYGTSKKYNNLPFAKTLKIFTRQNKASHIAWRKSFES